MGLELIGITRRFGSVRVVDGVDLVVERGDCHAFLGHNGAGKTTTMRLALGLDPHFEGQVRVDGFDARTHPREARARLSGLIEVPGFHGALDGPTNLAWLARLGGMGAREARLEATRLMGVVGLEHAGSKAVMAYSHGMKQRLGIAQALIGKPSVVLLDEPTNGLDPEGIAEIRELLGRLTREEGWTVLVSSHQLAQLAGLCNKISVLQRGRLLVSGSARDLLADSRARHRIVARDPHGLERAAARLGLHATPHAPGARDSSDGHSDGDSALASVYELGERDPAAVLRALVESGVEPISFAPHPVTLEELYLRHAARAGETTRDSAPPPRSVGAPARSAPIDAPPQRRIAPSLPVARVARYEAARAWSRGSLAVAFCLPALLSAVDLWRNHQRARAGAAAVESGTLASATDVTAFQALAQSLQAGVPLCAAVLVAVASQSLAGEQAQGTLRNLLLRPALRWQVVLGKAAALTGLAVAAYAFLVATSLAFARAMFEFRGVVEILPDGNRYELTPASELWQDLGAALASPLPALIAWSAVGVFVSTLVRSGALALALGLCTYVFTDLARALARGSAAEGWLLSAHLPSPLGDTSFLSYYADLAQGISSAQLRHADTLFTAPLVWCGLALLLSMFALSRKTVS